MDPYHTLLRPLIFRTTDPEWLKSRLLETLSWIDQPAPSHPQGLRIQTQIQAPIKAQLTRRLSWNDPRLAQTLWGLTFPNPIGLAAGFDKDGVASGIWSHLGFGFVELGTVTAVAQPGNPRPRLFRLPQDLAALNRMGFNNHGSAALATRLQTRWQTEAHSIPIGINLGKSKITSLETAAADYLASFRLLKDHGDYFVINISSPNTPGLRSLQAVDPLRSILATLQAENQGSKPLLIKIAPDLEWHEIDAILTEIQEHEIDGIIATNTTTQKQGLQTQILPATGRPLSEEAGGISGAPLRQRSTEVIRFIHHQTQGHLPIIGVGGIFTPEDAWDKIAAGASLLQIYTGWIYEGPWLVQRILKDLAKRLDQHNLTKMGDYHVHSSS